MANGRIAGPGHGPSIGGPARRRPQRPAPTALALALAFASAIAVVALVAGPAGPAGAVESATLPPPLVVVPTPSTAVVSTVLGQTPGGDVFIGANDTLGLPGAYVVHGDGTRTALAGLTYPSTESVVGPDGRLWVPNPSGMRVYDAAGASSLYPVPAPVGTANDALAAVRAGPDGRMWFTEINRNRIGAMNLDGTGVVTYPLPANVLARHLAAGPDGRMWAISEAGTIYAFTTDGVRTEYQGFGGNPSVLASFDGSVWVVVAGNLERIETDGSLATVARLWGVIRGDSVPDMVVANGRLWIIDSTDTLTSVDADGAVRRTPVPTAFSTGGYPTAMTMAATADGDLVGAAYGKLWRWDDPVPGPQLTVTPTLVTGPGTATIHAVISAQTALLAPLTGPIRLVLWSSDLRGARPIQAKRRIVAEGQLDADGHATIDVLLTKAVLPDSPFDQVDRTCCRVAVELPGAADLPGLSSRRIDIIGAPRNRVDVTDEVLYLDAMHQVAMGRPMDRSGLVYWAKRLSQGTPRRTPAASVVGSVGWRQHRVADAYLRWLGRTPDSGGLAHWATYLETHTTQQLDLAIGSTTSARDATGTSLSARASHLRTALGLSSKSDAAFRARLADGVLWSVVVRDGYRGFYAEQARVRRVLGSLAVRSDEPRLIDLLHVAGDERPVLLDRLPEA